MGNRIIIIIACILLMLKGYSQTEKGSNHVGISGLPIFDIFNFYPDNKISGGAIYFNYGTFVSNNLSFGLNFYYAGISNEYSTETFDFHREEQAIGLTGLNSTLRYYYPIKKKLLMFASISFGYGNYKMETTNLSTSIKVNNGNEPVILLMAGIGLNYLLSKNFDLELNIPYVFVNRFSNEPSVENLHAIAPSIGIQYYWNLKKDKN